MDLPIVDHVQGAIAFAGSLRAIDCYQGARAPRSRLCTQNPIQLGLEALHPGVQAMVIHNLVLQGWSTVKAAGKPECKNQGDQPRHGCWGGGGLEPKPSQGC